MTFPIGVQMLVLCGSQEVPTPLGPILTDLLISAEVTEVADGQAGFRLVFGGERDSQGVGTEYAVIDDGRLQPGKRVIVAAVAGADPAPLIDGLVTDVWLDPGATPGSARVVISGADLSVAMDLAERITSYPDMNEAMIVEEIVARYARFAIVPEVIPPLEMELPTPVQRTPIQHGTDLDYLYAMADRFGYTFTVRPGLVPGTNVARWGPPIRIGTPFSALTVGGSTLDNVESLTFILDGRSAITVEGVVPDTTGLTSDVPIAAPLSTLEPPLSMSTPYPDGAMLRSRQPRGGEGQSLIRAMALAQGRVNRSANRVARAEGTLEVPSYGQVLRAGSIVGVRGAGLSFDGFWAVDKVVHQLRRQAYRQSFSLTRDGTGALLPAVVP
uniref:Phage protein D n=1 Tax=Caulobacter sp. (strain K31) TaxID=366602 RepID=B0T4J2_CAUSK